jgi:hypothetical protein
MTETVHISGLFESLDNTLSQLKTMIEKLNEKDLNTIPFKDSWTPAQVAAHITKSNSSIAQAMSMEAKPADRNPDDRVIELKKIFLDFSAKFQSPEFILPTQDFYDKELLLSKIKKTNEKLTAAADNVNLSGIINVPIFGEITKLELLHFVLYHTQRHNHQLKNIMRIMEID